MYKTLGFFALLLFLLVTYSYAAPTKSAVALARERGKLIVGVRYDVNLFGKKDDADGQIKGFEIDIARAIAKNVVGDENKIEFKEVVPQTRIPVLNSGEVDIVIATMTITEERKRQVEVSEVYFTAGQSLLVPKDSRITSAQDLPGRTVIATKGSIAIKNLRQRVPDVNIIEMDNTRLAFTALKNKQGDAFTTDNSILLGLRQEDPNYKLVGGLLTQEPYGVAVRKGDLDMLKIVNDTLKKLTATGEYSHLYNKWIGRWVGNREVK